MANENAYAIEIRLASKNGWHTPAEARAYYGRYDRNGITDHWWGDGTGAGNHDNIVNYMLRGAEQGQKSVNYVLSDNKITMLVNPDNVAWASQGGNPTTISVEMQPTLGNEGYKKMGWLVSQLEERYGRGLQQFRHSYWFATQCPGTISPDRIRQEADKWKRGEYNPKPVPVPTPTPTPPPPAEKANLEWVKWAEGVRRYVFNKDANLWNFNSKTWNMQVVKTFKKGEYFDVYGQVKNKDLGGVYYLTQYSFEKNITNGVNVADLDVYAEPVPVPPTPPPAPEPTPEPPKPTKPEWEENLKDIDDTKFWFKQDADLIDITTGKSTGKTFKKDEEFVSSALTRANGVEYRITDYSFKKRIYNGVPIDKLTLTPPGVPNIPPVEQTLEDRVGALEKMVQYIVEFLSKLFNNFKR